MRLFQIRDAGVLWGMVRNVPLIVLFVSAVWYWAQEKRARSMICTLTGALASALLIRSTNPTLGDYSKPGNITILTIVTMSALQVLLVVYLGTEAEWSNWKVDLGLGSMAGLSLAVAQGLASQGPPWIGIILHSLVLATAGVLVLLVIRKLKEQSLTSTLAGALLLGALMILVARAVGYQIVLE